jgi:hypothetical protein
MPPVQLVTDGQQDDLQRKTPIFITAEKLVIAATLTTLSS